MLVFGNGVVVDNYGASKSGSIKTTPVISKAYFAKPLNPSYESSFTFLNFLIRPHGFQGRVSVLLKLVGSIPPALHKFVCISKKLFPSMEFVTYTRRVILRQTTNHVLYTHSVEGIYGQ